MGFCDSTEYLDWRQAQQVVMQGNNTFTLLQSVGGATVTSAPVTTTGAVTTLQIGGEQGLDLTDPNMLSFLMDLQKSDGANPATAGMVFEEAQNNSLNLNSLSLPSGLEAADLMGQLGADDLVMNTEVEMPSSQPQT